MSTYQSFSLTQKWAILKQVEAAEDKKRELVKLGIPRSTYYEWKKTGGETKSKAPHRIWNKTPDTIETKIKEYRLSNDPRKNSPARIVEQLEKNEGYLMTESGVKSVLVRKGLNGMLKPREKHYYIRPKAEKFLTTVCVDDIEFTRYKPRDTFILNFSDEASYFATESRVFGRRICAYDIIRGLKNIKKTYGRYPTTLRLDNARAHWANKVLRFCRRNSIALDHIDKGCPEENWPVESWHRNLNQDLVYRNGYATIAEWQKAVDDYRRWHNYEKRLRSDPIQRTPAEIAFAKTSPATQRRVKARLQRKLYGQTSVQKVIPQHINKGFVETLVFTMPFVSKMCVS